MDYEIWNDDSFDVQVKTTLGNGTSLVLYFWREGDYASIQFIQSEKTVRRETFTGQRASLDAIKLWNNVKRSGFWTISEVERSAPKSAKVKKHTSVIYLAEHYNFDVRETEVPKFHSVTGYGQKIPTQYMIRISNANSYGLQNRWYRVYATCFSNCASHWVTVNNVVYHLNNFDLVQEVVKMQK